MTLAFFLITFFLIYGLMHLYVIVRCRRAFSLSRRGTIPLVIAGLLLVCMPLLIRVAEKGGYEETARALSFGAYLWMGLILLMCSCLIFTDIIRLMLSLRRRHTGKDGAAGRSFAKAFFSLSLVVSVTALVWGYQEALSIRTEVVTVTSPRVPEEIGVFRIAQISDVHLGLIIREERLGGIISRIRDADPHMVVSTGDLVDGQINNLEGLVALWRDLNPPYGKIAVTGNHEYIAGIRQALDFTERAGFVILRDDIISIGGISVAGVEDPVARRDPLFKAVRETDVLARASEDSFVLLLKHRPFVDQGSIGLFDLQLSGHVHKGQIFPFSIATWLYYPVQSGIALIGDRGALYVSRGTGTWGPPVRLLSPPEITIVELRHGPEMKITHERAK